MYTFIIYFLYPRHNFARQVLPPFDIFGNRGSQRWTSALMVTQLCAAQACGIAIGQNLGL